MTQPKIETGDVAPEETEPRREPLDEYVEVRPLLRHIRVMNRFLDEVVDEPPYRQFHPELHGAFMKILNEEFAPHALSLALAITELEDAYPEIGRDLGKAEGV